MVYESSSDDPMYVLFLNVKNRRGTPWLTIDFTDCSVASKVVVLVQCLGHLTCNPGDAGSIPTYGIIWFFIRKGPVSSSLSLFAHSTLYMYIYIYIYIM